MRIRSVLHLFKFLTDYSFLEKDNNKYYLRSMYYAKHYIKYLHIVLFLRNILMFTVFSLWKVLL